MNLWRPFKRLEQRRPRVAHGERSAEVRAATVAIPGSLDPRECALLVLGGQRAILDAVPDADSLILKINAALDIVRLHGGQIAFVRIAFEDDDYRFAPTTNKEFSVLARERPLRNGTPDAEIHPAFAVQPTDILVRTTRLGAFFTTDLDEQLTNLGVTTLIVVGAHTSRAVLTTVREAADRDYRLIVLSDCCADSDAENHAVLVARIFLCQAEITSAAALYGSLAASKINNQRHSFRTTKTSSLL
jgi:nicotinamidase-related amidase